MKQGENKYSIGTKISWEALSLINQEQKGGRNGERLTQ